MSEADWGNSGTAWERLRDAIEMLDIEGWLSQYADTKPGGGHEIRLEVCPQCADDRYKLYVNTDHKHWVCYVCGWGTGLGDVVVLLASVSGRTMWEVRKELIQSVAPAPTGDLASKISAAWERPVATETRPEAVEVQLPGSDQFGGVVSTNVWNYARRRGLTEEEITCYKLRFASKLRVFTGPFVVFPVYFGGTPVGWQGRLIHDKKPAEKYISSDDVADWFWPIDDAFLPFLQQAAFVVLVEGVFDAAGLWRIGIPALCTFGKKIGQRQVALLRYLGIKAVVMAWDADAARTSSKRLARGAKHLRGEIEEAALRLSAALAVSVADLSDPPNELAAGAKLDPGDLLHRPDVEPWIRERLSAAMDVRSQAFFEWRLG